MRSEPQKLVKGLYYDLGITSPEELKIEAIASYLGATVKYRELTGCEARIIGVKDKAIITVNSTSSTERQRFSIGHELGHWLKDRGTVGNLCSKQDMEGNINISPKEIRANTLAAELLMPEGLIRSHLQGAEYSIDAVRSISSTFRVSSMAALRRITTLGCHTCFFAAYDSQGNRKFFCYSPELPSVFFPPKVVPEGSVLKKLLQLNSIQGKDIVDGNVWCRKDLENDSYVHEYAFHYFGDVYLTLVWWEDERAILESSDYQF